MLRRPRLAAFALTVLFAGGAAGHDYTLQNLRIDHPFARATPPGAQSGGVYLTIEKHRRIGSCASPRPPLRRSSCTR